MKDKAPQSGNMFVYILGAIFLFGILIVIMRGSFQEGSGIDGEKNVLLVGQVQRYGAELQRGVTYILQSGFSESDIRFASTNAASTYGTITDGPTRQVFDPSGGGVEWQNPPSDLQTTATPWSFSAATVITGVGTTCASSTCADLAAFLSRVPKSFCIQVNRSNNTTNPSGNPPVDPDGFTWNTPFTGTYTYSNYLNTTGNYLDGKMEGCVERSSVYYYYRVLLAR